MAVEAQPAALAGEGGYPGRAYAWGVVAILMVTTLLAYTDRQVLSLLVDPIRADLGIDDSRMSLLLGTAFALVYGIAGVPLGWLADVISRRNLLLAGVLVWSAGTLGCGLAHSYAQLFTGRIVVGLGEAVLSPAAISLISDYFPPARRGTAVGLFLAGIAIGLGAAILIGGGVLHAVEAGLLAGTALAGLAPWRLVLLCIGAPGLVWAFALLLIREPARRGAQAEESGATDKAALPAPWSTLWQALVPLYLVVAAASLVDNAVGAWTPTLLIRAFQREPAQVGVQLGLLVTVGFGAGVFLGGVLADLAGKQAGRRGKLGVCLAACLGLLPAAMLMNGSQYGAVLMSIPAYYALSGIVTACGFSAILDGVPNRSRGLAMAVAFFLNVAIGAAAGPSAVTFASEHLFGGRLGPALTVTVIAGFGAALLLLLLALWQARPKVVRA